MKKLLIFINCLILTFSFFVPAFAAEEEEQGVKTVNGYYDIEAPDYETEIALLVNADTDTVIYSKNADRITAPASLTKLVTAMVALNECSDLQKVITCSYDAIHSLDGTGSSVAGLVDGEKVPFEMLLYCLFLPSANDAAAVISEEFGNGDPKNFVAKMNAFVTELGCKNTHFANAHGLDDESVKGFDKDTQNRTTASDMYLIAKKALENDTIVKISSKYGKTMPATNKSDIRYLYNTNPLLNSYSDYYYEGAIGLKTGTTDKAGTCLISSARKDGYTYISIAMKGVDNYISKGVEYNSAFLMCRYMLRWAFSNIKMKILADNTYIMGEVGVEYGRGADYVGLVCKEPVTAVVHSDISMDDLSVKLSDDFPGKVPSPVKEGDVLGTAELLYKDVKIADMELVAYRTVKRNYLWAAFDWVGNIVKSKVFIVAVVIVVLVLIVLFFGTGKKRKQKKRRKNTINVVKDYSKLATK